VIDGGNCHYRDSQRRASLLSDRGIAFIDVGTSGGLAGEAVGYCLMIGGESEAVLRHPPVFQALAPAGDRGWGHVGPPGSGHFVKMVHNAVEYGLMEAYAEGFEILKAKAEMDLSLAQVAEIWCHGSVIRSWLLDLCARMLAKDEKLDDVRGWVADTGEGRWTVLEAIELDLSVPVITDSLLRRLRSRETDPFGDKMLAAMRREFGGHEVHSAD
jgi:6-phosphogluconate dehydrogenase